MNNYEFGLEPAHEAQRSTGERFEAIAFTFCKAATIILLTQRFALIAASALTAIFYVAAYVQGKRDTRCFLRLPLLIAAFWAVVAVGSVILMLRPDLLRHVVGW